MELLPANWFGYVWFHDTCLCVFFEKLPSDAFRYWHCAVSTVNNFVNTWLEPFETTYL